MSRRTRKSPLGTAFQRTLRSLTRASVRAGTKALDQAARIAAEHARPPPGQGDWIAGQALGPAGVRRYYLFRPDGITRTQRVPLMVMLHGCGQTARSFALSTRMNALAARERFLVLYPEQDRRANPQGCWEWFGTATRTGHAEAATLLAAIEQVCLLYPVDRDAVGLTGISAGAGMAALLATLYPTRFRALVMHSGVPPGVAHSPATAMAAMHGRRTPDFATVGAQQWPPLLVIHGDADRIVASGNARAAVRLWAAAHDAREGETRRLQRGRRYPAVVTDYHAGRQLVASLYEVQGLGHAWSGGAQRQPFSDPAGPDASRLAWSFLQRQLRTAARSTPAPRTRARPAVLARPRS